MTIRIVRTFCGILNSHHPRSFMAWIPDPNNPRLERRAIECLKCGHIWGETRNNRRATWPSQVESPTESDTNSSASS